MTGPTLGAGAGMKAYTCVGEDCDSAAHGYRCPISHHTPKQHLLSHSAKRQQTQRHTVKCSEGHSLEADASSRAPAARRATRAVGGRGAAINSYIQRRHIPRGAGTHAHSQTGPFICKPIPRHTHTARGAEPSQNRGENGQSPVQRHSAEEAGSDSSMSHWDRQRGPRPRQGDGEGRGNGRGQGTRCM